MKDDLRWIQRYNSYLKAFSNLEEAVELSKERTLTKLEKQELIQAFEFTHELAWKTLKDFLEESGNTGLFGSRDTTRLAFKNGLIENGEIWMEMVRSRNLTSHTYNEATSNKIVESVLSGYFEEFSILCTNLSKYLKNY